MHSRVIEVKELFETKLLYDFQIEAVSYEMFGKTIKTDKWLGFEDWQQIYDKLDSILGACVSPNLDDLSLDGFQISNSVEVKIQKCPLKKAYWQLFSLNERDVLPFTLSIKVARIDLAKLIRQLEEFKTSKKHGSSVGTKKCKIEIRRDFYPEYNPLPVSPRDRSKIPTYKPYKPSVRVDTVSNAPEDEHENNEYCPKPITNCKPANEEPSKDCYDPKTNNTGEKTVPTYIPSEIPKITNSLTDDEVVTSSPTNSPSMEPALSNRPIAKHSRNLRQRDVFNGVSNKPNPELSTSQGNDHKSRKRRYAEELEGGKIKYSQELFGSDDSDKESSKKELKLFDSGEALHELKNSKETTNSKSNLTEDKNDERSRKIRARRNSDDLKSKRSKKDDLKSSNSDIRKKNKALKIAKSDASSAKLKMSEEEEKRLREAHQKDIEALNAYNVKLEALTRSPSPVEILKLNHLKCGDILNTFEGCRTMLDKHFKEFRRQKVGIPIVSQGYAVKKMEDLNPLMTINIVDEQKSLAMLNKLKEIYETDTENVPCYTDLFMELMLPEWIVAIFMKEYNMSRPEAIRHITVQNQIDESQNSLG